MLVGAGLAGLAGEPAERAGQDADVGGGDVAVDDEVDAVALPPRLDVVGQATDAEQVLGVENLYDLQREQAPDRQRQQDNQDVPDNFTAAKDRRPFGPRKEPIEVATIIHRAAATVRPLMEQKQHELRLEVSEESTVVHADPTRAEQILANLLTNAGKYTKEGGRVTIKSLRHQQEAVISAMDSWNTSTHTKSGLVDRVRASKLSEADVEARMIEFLQAVKRDRKLREIPFYCCRVVRGVVSDDLMADLAVVCKACGAEDFVDVAKLPRDAAARALKEMLGR